MIHEFVETLNSYTDAHWRRYAFGREPLSGKLDEQQRREFYRGALSCAGEQAALLRERHGGASVTAMAEAQGLKIKHDETVSDGVFTTFATYTLPGEVTIYADNARATDKLIESAGFTELVGGVKTGELLLAHELFHHIENHTPDIYTLKKHILLFRIGRFENRSKLICLGEMTAMAFAKELTGLPCSPYIFDVLMLYAKNPQRAKQQFEMIRKICERDEE